MWYHSTLPEGCPSEQLESHWLSVEGLWKSTFRSSLPHRDFQGYIRFPNLSLDRNRSSYLSSRNGDGTYLKDSDCIF
ncbi:Activator Of 90 Kda Heat Shock Protein Atpase 2-Like [Manis pentadactyla]|nr:Activator Of 90 Kda Heat Shock Protein Atpase 2-Like [Manis pentadactyla]